MYIPRPCRVEKLRSALRRPCFDENNARRQAAVPCEERVDELEHGGTEGGAVPPHVDLPRHALDEIERREPLSLRARGLVHPERAPGGIVERVAGEGCAVELVLVEAAGQLLRPR